MILTGKVFRHLDGEDEFIANLTSTQRQGPLIKYSENNDNKTISFGQEGEVLLIKNDYVDRCGALICRSGDLSVLDAKPLCIKSNATAVTENRQTDSLDQLMKENHANFMAVVILSLCVLFLLFVSVIGEI